MRHFATCAMALVVAFGSVVAAQKAATPDDLDKAMKRLQPANAAAGKAIQSMAYADAKTHVATVKQALIDADAFWVASKRDDAIKLSKDAVAKVTALEQALSAPTPDQQAVLTAQKQVGGTCASCHKAFRAQDENQQYILKLQ
jgi:cytochrome c556